MFTKMDKICSLLSSEFVSEFPGFLLQMKAKYHLFDILLLSPGYLTRIPFRGEEDPPLTKVTNSVALGNLYNSFMSLQQRMTRHKLLFSKMSIISLRSCE